MSACLHHAIPQPAVCETCARFVAARQRRRRALIVIAAGLVPVIAIVAYLQTRPAPAPPPPQEPDTVVKNVRERLAAKPCGADDYKLLVERLVELDRLPEALDAANAAVGCGIGGRMKWHVAYLSQQLHRWLETIVMTTQLIQETPRDSDFWWWRGEAEALGKRPKLALIDLRQSLANSYNAQAAGFATARIYEPANALGEACEAARAWRYFAQQFGGEPTQEMRDRNAAMTRDRTCAAEHGTGTALLPWKVRVTIGEATGLFSVDPSVGTTIVSRMFAAKVGLESDTSQLGTAMVGDRPVLGELVHLDKVTAAGVAAQNIDALLVDELPTDGVLGLSFLWHFSFENAAGGIRVAPPDERL